MMGIQRCRSLDSSHIVLQVYVNDKDMTCINGIVEMPTQRKRTNSLTVKKVAMLRRASSGSSVMTAMSA